MPLSGSVIHLSSVLETVPYVFNCVPSICVPVSLLC